MNTIANNKINVILCGKNIKIDENLYTSGMKKIPLYDLNELEHDTAMYLSHQRGEKIPEIINNHTENEIIKAAEQVLKDRMEMMP